MSTLEGTLDGIIRGDAAWCIVHGDLLHILRNLPDGSEWSLGKARPNGRGYTTKKMEIRQ